MQKIRVFSLIFILAVMKMYSQEKVTYTDFVIKGKRQPNTRVFTKMVNLIAVILRQRNS